MKTTIADKEQMPIGFMYHLSCCMHLCLWVGSSTPFSDGFDFLFSYIHVGRVSRKLSYMGGGFGW